MDKTKDIHALLIEPQRIKIRTANQSLIDELSNYIQNGEIENFFIKYPQCKFGILLEVLEAFNDVDYIWIGLYDYIIERVGEGQFLRCLGHFSKRLELHPKILNDFATFLRKTNTDSINDYIMRLSSIPGYHQKIIDNLDYIFLIANPLYLFTIFECFNNYEKFDEFCSEYGTEFLTRSTSFGLSKIVGQIVRGNNKTCLNYIKNNFSDLIKSCYPDSAYQMVYYLSVLPEFSELIKTHKETIIENSSSFGVSEFYFNLDKKLGLDIIADRPFAQHLVDNTDPDKLKHVAFGAIIKAQIDEEIISLFNKFKKRENTNQIIYFDSGSFTLVFQIGTYVIKLSCYKLRYKSPQTPLILNCLDRTIIYDKKSNPVLYIETQKLQPEKEIADEEIKVWYKAMDLIGLINTDPRIEQSKDNFRVLENWEDNPIYIPIGEGGYTDEAGELTEEIKNMFIRPIVSIDVDCTYPKNHPNIKYLHFND